MLTAAGYPMASILTALWINSGFWGYADSANEFAAIISLCRFLTLDPELMVIASGPQARRAGSRAGGRRRLGYLISQSKSLTVRNEFFFANYTMIQNPAFGRCRC